jgi:hypothetical protein
MSLALTLAQRTRRGVLSLIASARAALRGAALSLNIPPSALVRYDLIQREYYALPMLLASMEAQRLGLAGMTVAELGVGAGGGMINLCELATLFARQFKLDYRIVGLDSGAGLPDPRDYRDHPELWRGQQFVHDRDALRRQLTPNAKVIYGEVRDTAPQLLAEIDPAHPLGFIVADLDYYSSTRDALDGLLTGPADRYLPAITMYVDDVEAMLTANRWCGAALALEEFNAKSAQRKIEQKAVRTKFGPKRGWHRRIYCCHVLDHPARHAVGQNPLGEPHEIDVTVY